MGTTLGRTLGTTLGTTVGGTQHTARSLVDQSLATNPAPGCSTGLVQTRSLANGSGAVPVRICRTDRRFGAGPIRKTSCDLLVSAWAGRDSRGRFDPPFRLHRAPASVH
jgi:hypothetical protein